jgi:leucyl aminopeptidase
MTVTVELRDAPPADADALVVPAVQGRPVGHGVDDAYLAATRFTAKADRTTTVAVDGRPVVVVGLGRAEAVDATALRRGSALATRAGAAFGRTASYLLEALPADADAVTRQAAAQAVAEGAVLGAYRFDRYKAADPDTPADHHVTVVDGGSGGSADGLADAVALGARIGAAVTFARDLVNEPGGSLTPPALADAAVALAERDGLGITVLDEEALRARGMGGILGVNRGSFQPARMIQLTYEPTDPRGHLALVGKGITFDSGGLSLKTADGMMTMKDDMGGAAAILGAFAAITAVAPPCRVSAFVPVTDNMTGPDATRPGDVLRMYGGKTVEVLNTDAEGRLILGDALVAASEARPDAIVDLATLTGAVISALGSNIAGVFANDDAWLAQVQAAAARAGERVWPLPLVDDYRPRLDSDVADLRNITRDKEAGSIIAGLFLREFVGEGIAWAHLDIAGTAWRDDVDGEAAKGGTGWGVRTLLELARTFTPPS